MITAFAIAAIPVVIAAVIAYHLFKLEAKSIGIRSDYHDGEQ